MYFFRIPILVLVFLGVFGSHSFAQDAQADICRVYGKVQGVFFDAFKRACSTTSSSEACDELLAELSNSLNAATLSRKEYVEINTESCIIGLKKTEDGIYFTLESFYHGKELLKEAYRELRNMGSDIVSGIGKNF